MKPYSLTRRLITIVLLIELVSALCVTGVALIYERHMHFRAFDILLRGRADSLLGAVQDSEDANDNVMLDGSEASLPVDDIYEVRDASGRILGRSANWKGSSSLNIGGEPGTKALTPEFPNREQKIFSPVSIHDKTYRVIRIGGLRIVDPGDKDGGVRRYVTIYYGSAVQRVWKAVFRAVGFYALSSLLVLATTGILMSWLLNRGLAPLRALASTAEKVSVSSWSFSPPEDARMTRELEPLVTALERVLLGLEQSFEKQKRFVGDAAHELKTGVAVVKSSLQLLSMKPRTPGEYEAGLERCLVDCQRMEDLVAQMLTLARVEETASNPSDKSVTDVYAAMEEVAQQLDTMARTREIPILFVGAETLNLRPLNVHIEPEQFKLLCSNLLINALQHSPADSVIRTEIKTRGAFAEIEIRDEGYGIDSGDLPHIFERFFRSDPSRSRDTGGTGLGLAICKAITDRFHGTIQIQSERNAGTIVTVRFPLNIDTVADINL
jgi:signal transduction histidine kinase